MADTVFFSWQSDRKGKTNKYFLEKVLKQAIEEIGAERAEFEEAERPLELDKDTAGVSGSPPILDTIFRKIEASSVFVADLSFVGETDKGRALLNPNVLIEYGWALAKVGDARIIGVINTAFGAPSIETMPFDIAHKRWPMTFHLEDTATKEDIDKERVRLIKVVKAAVTNVLDSTTKTSPAVLGQLTSKSHRSSFLDDGDQVCDLRRNRLREEVTRIFWRDAPQSYMRVIPEQPIKSLKRADFGSDGKIRALPMLMHRSHVVASARNNAGFVYFEQFIEDGNITDMTSSLTQITLNGELWSIDGETISLSNSIIQFPEFNFARTLSEFIALLQREFDYVGPVTVEAGYWGISGMSVYLPPLENGLQWQRFKTSTGVAVGNEIHLRLEHVRFDPDDEVSLKFAKSGLRMPTFQESKSSDEIRFRWAYKTLIPFFEEFWDFLGEPRIDILPK